MFKTKVYKSISVLIAVVMLFSVFGSVNVMAGVEEFIVNGGFEQLKSDGSPSAWTIGASFGTDFTISSDSPHGGENSIRISTYKEQVFIAEGIRDMVAGKTYKLTFNTNVVTQNGRGFAVKLEFRNYDANGQMTRLAEADFQRYFTDAAKDEWEEQTIEFIAPGNAATVLLRYYGGGEAYLDDVSLKGEKPVDGVPAMNLKNPVPGAEDMIGNGSFEELNTSSGPVGWLPFSGVWGGSSPVSVVSEGAYDGQNCIKLEASDTSKPWLNYYIRDIVPGAEYQLSAWLKQIQVGTTGAVVKFEFYSDRDKAPGSNLGQDATITFAPYFGGWQQVATTFVPPESCELVVAYLRLYGPGKIYWDKAECYMTATPQKFNFETDNYFYYSDWEHGEATVAANPIVETPQGSTVDFALKDSAGEVLESVYCLSLSGTAKFCFNVSSLENEGQPYIVEYVCKDAEGNELDRGNETIYRYDRPTSLNGDGVYMKAGQPFLPIMGYHVQRDNEDDYAYCNEAGVNVIQFSPGTNEAALIRSLDLLEQYDLMAFVALYTNMKPAGHPDNVDSTKRIVEIVKDHPATFGYMIMDEPFQNGCNIEDLKNSYKIIRDIDPEHPVYMVEAPPHAASYGLVGKCVDILGVDPYPNGIYPVETFVSKHVRLAKEAVNYKKPVYAINQVFRRGINPTPDNVRHMNYQALFEGAEGIGYYDIRDYYGYNSGQMEHLWERLCWDGVKFFAENEAEDALRGFLIGEYPVLNVQKGENVWWRTYEKEGLVYAVVLNQTVDEIKADIPLDEIGSFTAEELNITAGLPIKGTGTLSVTLEPGECALYKITPETNVPVQSITVTAGAESVFKGSTLTMSAIVLPENAVNKSVVWAVTNGAGSATIDAVTGFLTATEAGKITVTATAEDGSGIKGSMEVNIVEDDTAPLSTAAMEGVIKNGWYSTPVTLSIVAVDTGSGLDKMQYRLAGSGEWTVYTEPVVISQDGTYTVEYRAADKVGNVEDTKYIGCRIDRLAPVTMETVTGTVYEQRTYNSHVIVALSAMEAAGGSGTAKTEYSFDGNLWSEYIGPLTLLNNGTYNIHFRSTDYAGNVETVKSTSITIVMTADVMTRYLIEKLEGMDLHQGIKNSLTAKLSHALNSFVKKDKNSAANLLNAFIHEVSAQSGKKLASDQANELITDAGDILNLE